ncbi:hypothetical protein HN51_030027 [Arachis hypogaea]
MNHFTSSKKRLIKKEMKQERKKMNSSSCKQQHLCDEPLMRSFRRRCSKMVKEHRTRFYILRRCVAMLICWTD